MSASSGLHVCGAFLRCSGRPVKNLVRYRAIILPLICERNPVHNPCLFHSVKFPFLIISFLIIGVSIRHDASISGLLGRDERVRVVACDFENQGGIHM
jgi:hypothetical protein